MIVKELNPGDIRLDGDTQPRTRLSQSMVEEYAEAMQNGDNMPPIDVYYDGENYWLADGFHRYHALTRLDSQQPIKCNVYEGTLDDAKWHSYGANKTHGLRRTNEDKAEAVKAALAHPKSKNLSDAALAEHVGIHRETVLKYRHKQESDLSKTDKSTSRTGRDGRKINTANIGKRPGKKTNPTRGNTISPKAFKPIRGHSKLPPMISLSLPVNKPEITAAALWQEFPVSYIETLIQIFSKFIQEEKGE